MSAAEAEWPLSLAEAVLLWRVRQWEDAPENRTIGVSPTLAAATDRASSAEDLALRLLNRILRAAVPEPGAASSAANRRSAARCPPADALNATRGYLRKGGARTRILIDLRALSPAPSNPAGTKEQV